MGLLLRRRDLLWTRALHPCVANRASPSACIGWGRGTQTPHQVHGRFVWGKSRTLGGRGPSSRVGEARPPHTFPSRNSVGEVHGGCVTGGRGEDAHTNSQRMVLLGDSLGFRTGAGGSREGCWVPRGLLGPAGRSPSSESSTLPPNKRAAGS